MARLSILALSGPPGRRRVARRDLCRSKRYEVAAFVRIALQPRAVAAPHVALELVNRHRLGAPDDVERDRLVGIAANATNLEINVPCIERVADRRRQLRWPLQPEHAFVPCLAGEPISPSRAAQLAPQRRVLNYRRFSLVTWWCKDGPQGGLIASRYK